MTVVTGLTPYDLSRLLAGPCRVLYAPTTVAIPTRIADAVAQVTPYAPQTGWIDFGATTAGTAYGRNLSVTGYEIEQASGAVAEAVGDVVRSVQTEFGEISPEALKIMEQSQSIDTVAAAANKSAEKQVPFGTIEDLDHYRIVFLGRRPKGVGADVTEPVGAGGRVRGPMVGACLYRTAITGDNVAVQIAKGNLANLPLAFQAFPEGGEIAGEEHGKWLVEQSGTIAAV